MQANCYVLVRKENGLEIGALAQAAPHTISWKDGRLTRTLLSPMSTAAVEIAWVGAVIGVVWTVLSRAVRRIGESFMVMGLLLRRYWWEVSRVKYEVDEEKNGKLVIWKQPE
jgi:hypothetical protein